MTQLENFFFFFNIFPYAVSASQINGSVVSVTTRGAQTQSWCQTLKAQSDSMDKEGKLDFISKKFPTLLFFFFFHSWPSHCRSRCFCRGTRESFGLPPHGKLPPETSDIRVIVLIDSMSAAPLWDIMLMASSFCSRFCVFGLAVTVSVLVLPLNINKNNRTKRFLFVCFFLFWIHYIR